MDISKLDAAKRQIDTAIDLYFKNADPVSIHSLTAAAHQILMDISNKTGGEMKSFIKTEALKYIVKNKRKEYLEKINASENFFKHANKDPDSLLKFKPEQAESLLFDAINMYMQLTQEMPVNMQIFKSWFFITHPKLIADEVNKQFLGNSIFQEYSVNKNRAKFFKEMLEFLLLN